MCVEDILNAGYEENAREFNLHIPLYVMFAREIYARRSFRRSSFFKGFQLCMTVTMKNNVLGVYDDI